MIYDKNSQINYYDLDSLGNVKLTALLRRVNLAAGANVEDMDIGFERLASHGLTFVIQRFGLRVFQWPTYHQKVRLRTWPAEIVKGTFRRNGDLWDEAGNKLVEWTGLWVLLDINERKVKRPKALPVELPAYGLMDVDFEAKKIDIPDVDKISSYLHIVRFSELDTNQHMNNAVYGELIANVLDMCNAPTTVNWREVQFNYLNETLINDEVAVECRQLGSIYYVTGNVGERQVFTASINVSDRFGFQPKPTLGGN